MTRPSPKSAFPQADEAEVLKRSRALGEPANYFRGAPDTPPLLPSNILIFRRLRNLAFRDSEQARWQHHRFILLIAMRGSGLVGLDTEVHRLQERQCLLIFPFQSHCFFQVAPTAIHWILVSFELPQAAGLAMLRNQAPRSMTRDDLVHLRDLLRAWPSNAELETSPLHLALWLHAMAKKSGPVKIRPAKPVPSDPENLVSRVNRFVLANRDRPIPITLLGETFGLSASSLRSRFKAHTGRSLGRHIREIKLNHACELLHGTRLRIEEISELCGYESLFAFSRAFRTAHGCSPSQYRATLADRG